MNAEMVTWEIPQSRADAIVEVLNAARAMCKQAEHAHNHYSLGKACMDCARLRKAVEALDPRV